MIRKEIIIMCYIVNNSSLYMYIRVLGAQATRVYVYLYKYIYIILFCSHWKHQSLKYEAI
nr:MAG TPA: hypothetical protein [Caudoviricetes sp.]